MPIIYEDRAAISLYDAQTDESGNKRDIPADVIRDVAAALRRFQHTCEDFGVLDGSVRVVATEATRTATNRDEVMNAIKQATGRTVEMLSKEEEGRLGAIGISSSVDRLDGFCIDLGGEILQFLYISSLFDISSINVNFKAPLDTQVSYPRSNTDINCARWESSIDLRFNMSGWRIAYKPFC